MNPTPTELALIAAVLSKDQSAGASQNLQKALELWFAAARYLQKVEREARMQPPREEPKRIPLDERLIQLMPRLSPSMRKKNFHTFLVARSQSVSRYRGTEFKSEGFNTPEESERIARENEAILKKEGVLPHEFGNFPQWREAHIRTVRSKAGKAGASETHANGARPKRRKSAKR
jgi:hypothetical protein